MVVVELIVALGVPLWLGVEQLLHARSEAQAVTGDVDPVRERALVVEPSTLRTA
jgi:hypothetical protein